MLLYFCCHIVYHINIISYYTFTLLIIIQLYYVTETGCTCALLTIGPAPPQRLKKQIAIIINSYYYYY